MHDLEGLPKNWRRVKTIQNIEGFYSLSLFFKPVA